MSKDTTGNAGSETPDDRWVVWVEPFSVADDTHTVHCKTPAATAIAQMREKGKRNGYDYESDEQALSDFMSVHWAWFGKPEPDPDTRETP